MRISSITIVGVLLASVLAAQAEGQIKRKPVDPSKVLKTPDGIRPAPEAKGTLDIKRLVATRDAKAINVLGEIRNTQASGASSDVTWTILRKSGNGWSKVKSGTATVKGYSTVPVTAVLPPSNDAQAIRLDVSCSRPSLHTAKDFVLAARDVTFVVTYSTAGWVLIRDDREKADPNKLVAQEARRVRETLNSLGFNTQIRITRPGPLGDTNRAMLYARAENEIERTFDSKAQADEFANQVKSLVPAFGRDIGTGLRMRRTER